MSENLNHVRYAMEYEGFDYCFRGYSYFEEVKDPEFHKLREAYIAAADALQQYVDDNSDESLLDY